MNTNRFHNLLKYAAVGTLSLAVGAGVGAAGQQSQTTEPAPAATITKTVTPSSCLSALYSADEVQKIAGRGFTLASQGTEALIAGDYATLTKVTNEITQVSRELDTAIPQYRSYAQECRGEAGV